MELVPDFASLVAVIVAGPPGPTPVTRPVPSTVATAVLLEVHAIALPVRMLLPTSRVVAESCCVEPTRIVAEPGLTVTVATGTGFTVMRGVVTAGADSLVAVIVAVPLATAVTVIVAPTALLTEVGALTVRTAVLLETQLTVRPTSAVPFPSRGVAVST